MKRRRAFIPVLAACGILFGLFLPGALKMRDLKNRNADLREKNRRLERENVLLEEELRLLENDKVYQEKVLREKMGVVRKDEIPVKMIPAD